MQTSCGTVLAYCPHITPVRSSCSEGTEERHQNRANMSRGHREAVCAQTASRSPDSTFWGASRLFLRCTGPMRPIFMRILRCTVALAHLHRMRSW
eukprot:scaffold7963_cov116-Isochrysis_galbana.AAC.24